MSYRRLNGLSVAIIMGILLFADTTSSFADTPTIQGCQALNNSQLYKQPGNEDYAVLTPGTDGWVFRSRLDLKYRFKLTDRTKDAFRRLNSAFKSKGTDVVIAMMPTRGIVHSDKLLPPYKESYDQEVAKKNYLKMLKEIGDTGLVVADMSNVDTVPDYFLKDDNHWTASAAKLTAQNVADAVRKLPAYEGLKKTAFKTLAEQNVVNPPHRFIEFINSVCGSHYSGESTKTTYRTVPVGSEVSADDLFSDNVQPEITLIGTSNSTNPEPSFANFEGFLKEHLEADVLNEAVSGGSLQGSISQYLVNGTYERTKPKILIWEMSAYYGFNRQDFLRELVPSVYGTCSDQEAQSQASGTLGDKGTVVLEGLSDRGYSSHNYYLALKLSDKENRDIKVRFQHADGKTDTVKLERPARSFPDNPGVYFAELSDVMNSSLDSVTVEGKKGGGSYEAKICKAPDFSPEVAGSKMTSPSGDDEALAEAATPDYDGETFLGKIAAQVRNFYQYSFVGPDAIQNLTSLEPPSLPDLTGYTKQAILQKIPALQKGNVVIDNMEGAPPLRKYAFDKRLVEFQNIQKRVEPEAVHILSGVYDLKTLMNELKDKAAIVETAEGYVVRRPIAVYHDATLILKDLQKPVLLSQERGAFIASVGNLFIVDSTVIGWSEMDKKPAVLQKDNRNFRPFITMWDGSEIYIANSSLQNLGYALSKSYGISLSTNDVVQEEYEETYGDLPPPTGWIIDSQFEQFYFGFYSYEAVGAVLLRNTYKDSVIYGIDPHDRSEKLIIAYNKVSGSKKKHGIILSREVNDSFIIYNDTRENKGSGIMLDRNCVNTVVAYNTTAYNKGDGVTLYESPRNLLYGNKIEYNKGAGIRIRNSWDITVVKGENRFNQDHSVIIYEDDLSGTKRDFEMDPVTAKAGAVLAGVKLNGNGGILKTDGMESVRFENIDLSEASLAERRFSGDVARFVDDIDSLSDSGVVTFEITGK